MAVAYINGFETGDGSEMGTIGLSCAAQNTTVRTGAWAWKQNGNVSRLMLSTLSAAQSVFRSYLRVPALPGTETDLIFDRGTSARLNLQFTATNRLQVVDISGTMGLADTTGTALLAVNQWYRIEVILDCAANGAVRVLVDGVPDIDTTHTGSVSNTTEWQIAGGNNPNEYFYDDLRVDTGTLQPIGPSQIIARQGTAGTPTYNAWTKNGAATAALCWSDTPFSTATNCSDNVLSDAQTMLVSPFSATQSGHGVETIGLLDTINACKVAAIAKTALAGNMDIRRRVSGVDTNETFALTPSDAYYQTSFFIDTPANLDNYQIGAANDLVATLQTVEDMWLIVDYTLGATPGKHDHGTHAGGTKHKQNRSQADQAIAAQGGVFATPLTGLLKSKDQFPDGPGKGPNYDWPNPTLKKPNLELRTWTQSLDLLLVGKDQFFGPAGMGPDYDWPNPTLKKWSPVNRGFTDNVDVELLSKDTFFGAPGMGPDYDFPNPTLRRDRWGVAVRTMGDTPQGSIPLINPFALWAQSIM